MTGTSLTVSLPGNALRTFLEPAPHGVTFLRWDLDGPAPAQHIDIVVPPYMGATPRLAALEEVTTRLVQSQSIGYDGVEDYLPMGHRFANAASVHETSTAELALGLIIASQRGFPGYIRAADREEWVPERQQSLADRRVLILGLGGVGRAIEARLQPFEVEIIRVARTARETDAGYIHSFTELPTLLPTADIVVLAVPLTEENTGFVDDKFLTSMAQGALLVNVARGAVVDTDALVRHLSTGRIRAALDVTDPEPLPAGHPLWGMPNALITPHVGGATSAMMPRMAQLIRRQIDLMLAGKPAENVVLETLPR